MFHFLPMNNGFSGIRKVPFIRFRLIPYFSIADLDGGMDIGDPDSPERFAPMRLNALLMVLTFEGTLEIHLDYVSYIVKPNSFITIMPTHALQLDRIGKDFKGRLLIASKEFLDDCNPGGGNRTQATAELYGDP